MCLLVCFVYLAASATSPIGIYDEGIPVFGGYRVLHGEAPYRDFWTWYAPGVFYWNALLFRVFGESLWVSRLADCAVRASICVVVYLFTTRMAGRRAAVAACAAAAIWLGHIGNYGYNAVPATLIALLAVWCVARFADDAARRARMPFLAGLLCGATALFRHDVAVYAGVASVASLAACLIAIRRRNRSSFSAAGWRTLIAFVGGSLLGGLPLLLACSRLAPISQLFNDLIKMPSTLMRPYRSVSMPPPLPDPRPLLGGGLSPAGYAKELLNSLEYWVPILVLVCSWVWAARLWRREREAPASILWTVFPLTLAATCLLAFAAARTDLPHLLPATVLAIPLAAGMAHAILRYFRRKWFVGVVLAGFFGAALFRSAYVHVRLALLPFTAARGEFAYDCPHAVGICVPTDYAKMVEYVAGHVPPDQRIYVGFTDHSRVWNNDLMLYFLAGRLSSTRILDLHPGVITSKPVQEATIEELRRFNVRTLVLLDQTVNEGQVQPRTPEAGGETLDRYIRAKYEEVERFGAYGVWNRK